MKVEKLLQRLKIEFIKINLLQSCLDTIIVFLLGNLGLYTLDLEITGPYSNLNVLIGVSSVFFLVDLIYRVRKYNVELYEEKNPELNEILRTARDNIDNKNIASQALFDELVETAREVSSDSIIPSQKIIRKVLVIGGLCFLTIFSGLMNIHIEGPDQAIFPDLGLDSSNNTEEPQIDVRNGSQILGQPTEIDIQERDLEFEIQGTGSASEQEFSFSTEDEDFTVDSTMSGVEDDRQLAKSYSDAIRNIQASE